MNYYNEFDKKAAAWLRDLIASNLIPKGIVDDRSITEVTPNDLSGFTQCHFFAGIAGWSLALDLAGWPRDRQIWTGSCPCQPFSIAGNGKGTADDRHLWPTFFKLIEQCHPDDIAGEQVASQAGLAWLDIVSADLEKQDYAVGTVDTCSPSVGAPNIRQRLVWVACSLRDGRKQRRAGAGSGSVGRSSSQSRVADYYSPRLQGWPTPRWAMVDGRAGRDSSALPDPWANPEWLECRDGFFRPIEPGLKPLVDWVSEKLVRKRDPNTPIEANETSIARVTRLKGYGNAINPVAIAAVMQAYMEVTDNV